MRDTGVRVPGDKSLAHRALLVASLARTASLIRGLPDGDDVAHTVACLRALGARIDVDERETRVQPSPWTQPLAALSCGNSGTLARLLMGAIAGARETLDVTLTGDASLSSRPMARVVGPLRALALGGGFALTASGTLPARIRSSVADDSDSVTAATDATDVVVVTGAASAQVKSAVILASRNLHGRVVVREPLATRDHTERMLRALLCTVHSEANVVTLACPLAWDGFTIDLAGDPSSAALLAAYAVLARRVLVVDDLLWNPFRTGFFTALQRMGAFVEASGERLVLGEPVVRVVVRASAAPLRGVEVAAHEVPGLVDEVPALAVVAACAHGTTRIRGVHELRLKESDRLARVVDLVVAFGGEAHAVGDDLVIEGRALAPPARVAVRTDGDHRIAMAAHVLARAHGVTAVLDVPGCERTSYPGFVDALDALDALDDTTGTP